MSHYPDGMTARDWKYLDGGPECRECGAQNPHLRFGREPESELCWNCGELSGWGGPDEEPDPDAARDRMIGN